MIPLLATDAAPTLIHRVESSVTVHPLADEHKTEVLAFLAERPLHTVNMASFIRDNGLISPLNRGSFFACRSEKGELEGVALIGHATLMETRTEAALAAFARLAQDCPSVHMLLGEQEKVEQFWHYYSEGGQTARLVCRELLFEQRWPVEVREHIAGLRLATLDDLELVMPVQAEMAFAESGINPVQKDPAGFRRRCARRIEQGRVWVWVENDELLFKTDIISDTPEVVYLEGIYVNPRERDKGYGLRCLSQLGRSLLMRTGAISVLVNEQNLKTHDFYRQAGYTQRACYDTIFLQHKAD